MATKPRIADVTGLRWTQPRTMTRHFELRADADVLATLTFVTMFGSLAKGESADGCWTFKRGGFIRTHVTVRECQAQEDLAIFRNNTWSGGGTLELPDGRRYAANSNFWQTRYDIRTIDETPVVTFERIRGMLHLGSEVTMHAGSRRLPELPWLIMLGWYLTVMQHRDAAVVA
jgi:hypothetical protein